MTREEHIEWCKKRAMQEFNYYSKNSNLSEAIRNGCTSMASDLRKHPDTNQSSMITLCIMQIQIIKSKQSFVNFINGFK